MMKSPKQNNIWAAAKGCFMYQLGSLAYAAVLFTFFRPLTWITRRVFNYLLPKTYKEKEKLPYCGSVCCMYSCCCFTNYVRFISKYALVWAAMTGDGLWESIMQIFYLIKRNKQRHASIQNVGNMFTYLGKLFLCLFCTLICYVLMFVLSEYNDIQESISPIVGFVLLSYTTASFFIDLHGSSSYTLLLVSFIDEEVEKTHFGREEAYNCPLAIRPLINQLRNSKF